MHSAYESGNFGVNSFRNSSFSSTKICSLTWSQQEVWRWMIGSPLSDESEKRPQLDPLMRKRENSRQKSRFVLSADKPLPIIFAPPCMPPLLWSIRMLFTQIWWNLSHMAASTLVLLISRCLSDTRFDIAKHSRKKCRLLEKN